MTPKSYRPPRLRLQPPLPTFPVVHVRLAGDIARAGADRLGHDLAELLDDSALSVADWIIDLGDLDYLSSRCLGALVAHQRRLAEAGLRLALVVPSSWIRQKIELLGLHERLLIARTKREALALLLGRAEPGERRLQIRFPADLQACVSVRRLAADIAIQSGLSEMDAMRLELITDELCNNAVEHGAVGSTEPIELVLTVRADSVVIEVVDPGGKFFALPNAAALSTQVNDPTGDIPLRRRGLILVQKMARDLEVEVVEGATHVRAVLAREGGAA
ncbi:MAG: ATP-binding protein [Candidatus Schekmanbacteria bacterium]|nr:ATP-binding protein [Candidatus Schekmanbacteria bacterium]